MRYDAVVLAGGRASRLGGSPKADVVVAGTTLLDHALAATAGADRTCVVGPVRAPDGVLVTREDPPFGGPVAGIEAGLAALARPDAPDHVLLLAVDVPAAVAAVEPLLAALAARPRADGAHLVARGRAQWLTGVYRRAALSATMAAYPTHGASVRRLMAPLDLIVVPDDGGLSDDADTWDDVSRLSARAQSRMTEEGTR